jgi:hypothetical protein
MRGGDSDDDDDEDIMGDNVLNPGRQGGVKNSPPSEGSFNDDEEYA